MSKKNFKLGLLVAFISIVIASIAIIDSIHNKQNDKTGDLVFANSYNNGTNIAKIEISKTNQEIDLFLENNFWRVKQADGYYANLKLISSLLTDVNNARYYSYQDKDDEAIETLGLNDKDSTNIKVISKSGDVLDNFVLGKKTPNGKFRYFTDVTNHKIWLVDASFEMPEKLMSWIEQPLISYSPDTIEEIKINGETNIRTDSYKPFSNAEGKYANRAFLLEQFNFLIAKNVVLESNFNPENIIKESDITLTSFQGLVTHIKIYFADQKYWAKISLFSTPLPTNKVSAYIKDNSFLYQGWIFEIPEQEGKVLLNYSLSTKTWKQEKN